MAGAACRVYGESAARLELAELLEPEVFVDPAHGSRAHCPILIKQQPGAEHCSIVVELDRAVKIMQRLNRAVAKLLSNGIVEPGRRVGGVELLRESVLVTGQAVALLRKISLAQIATQKR